MIEGLGEGFWTGVLVGVVPTFIVMMILMYFALPRKGAQTMTAAEKARERRRNVPPLALILAGLGGFALMFGQGVKQVMAQTPVALEIPTDIIFTEANNWIATLAPVAAIGIGIAIATSVLGYVGMMIIKGFKGG